ncbi:serine/threonine protein kinase [Streptomyces eurocidicus]|uniref:non-specific serine/threonine protein kinase n=1 Tax=Streptomyces eurocidicus TaxID=66423 RepID=A0A2N8NY89_STREU|nr:Stk1 family PASTA domain-containing Ser/Thr kinase [Streptomyces eurocidicus]MBB5119868.1 serine/threonine-protein kinase [Streptomyces eurocidicus]MBF6050885.1 Stk1 family PASTA domain-containing Ser/Thr kinase [Streptomyces eurocidicus]PNE33740.1 serine/threonine protein kinase [Streptomyces eurocidicus]
MEEPRRLGGRYELGSVLGRGGMAEVYLAHDTRLGRTVAVKTLRVDLARDPSFQARFRREAQSAASLNHPSIVAVYDTGEDYVDGVSIPYIVMEYVDGSTLRELLHSGRKLLPERSLEMTTGVLQALEYSHRAGIVHRDIKPANVMLTRTGQVKVMDFGIARAMGDSGMTMTQTAAVIGTAQYLSPEQAKGEQVDARSDLYSTGCLLYELLTVRPPFVGDSPVAVAYQHVREEPNPPSTFDPEITPEMDAIVLKALTKDPDYRYQSADEMRADIEAALEGQPVAATQSLGAVGYGEDQPTTMLRSQDHGAGQTSMLPPVRHDDGGYGGYDDGSGHRRAGGGGKKSNLSTILLIVAGVLVLVGAIFIGKSLFGGGANNGDVTVPRLIGQTLADAKKMGENVDLKVVEGGTKACDQDKGKVCEQNPQPDSKVDRGAEIKVTVSEGAPKIEVPDVTEKQVDNARKVLEDKGFVVKVKQKVTDEASAGTVLSQDPAGLSKATKGSEVTLTVAEAAQTKQVPSVVNQPFEAAKKQLTDLGFKVEKQEEESTSAPGTVIRQSPDGNTAAKPNSTVTLTVAKAGQKVTVPATANTKLKDAKKALTDLGLQVGPINGPQDDNAVVINTNPGPGAQVDKNTPISIFTQQGVPATTGGDVGGPGGANTGTTGAGTDGGFFGGNWIGGRRN